MFMIVLLTLVPTAASSVGSTPQRLYFWGSVCATIKGPGRPTEALVSRPSLIGLFCDGSWYIEHLHWTGWGKSVAHGSGISNASNGIPSQAAGKRIKRRAQMTLSHPGRFGTHEVYRCFQLTVPGHRSSDLHGCLQHDGSYWLI
jgi:hypothetical protein